MLCIKPGLETTQNIVTEPTDLREPEGSLPSQQEAWPDASLGCLGCTKPSIQVRDHFRLSHHNLKARDC
jgi:hypothetical protein